MPESSALKQKLKASELEDFLNFFRNIPIVRDRIGREEWSEIRYKVIQSQNLSVTVPFTDAAPFYKDLFEDVPERVSIYEDSESDGVIIDASMDVEREPDIFREAAQTLKSTPLWQNAAEHFVHKNETMCRTTLDLILLSAVDLAQQLIGADEELDNALAERHALCVDASKVRIGQALKPVKSWIVLHPEVDIPDQPVTEAVSMHGPAAYMLGVVEAETVASELSTNSSLTVLGLYELALPGNPQEILATLTEAKSTSTTAARIQALSQGAAVCVMTRRRSMVDMLTDGRSWIFYHVQKQDYDSEIPNVSGTIRRRVLRQSRAPQSFKASATRELDVLRGNDLAIVLRLITLAGRLVSRSAFRLLSSRILALTLLRA
ncbi:hypothetical protein C8R46DRAFT_1118403 [Mycena filopes]|nr:hypothetical protein C8R46DRAFT_1118403 [Mycena filopes]